MSSKSVVVDRELQPGSGPGTAQDNKVELDKLAITTWTYEGLAQLESSEVDWSVVFWSLAVPSAMTIGFILLAYPVMRMRLPGTKKSAKKA